MNSSDLYSQQRLCAYLFAATEFDSGKDIILSFNPLIEHIINSSSKKILTPAILQKQINTEYGVTIPRATLDRLLYILAQQGKIRYNTTKTEFSILTQSETYKSELNRTENILSGLFIDFQKYLASRKHELNEDEAKNILCYFIFNNSYTLTPLIQNKSVPPHSFSASNYITEIIDFLLKCKEDASDNYSAFLRLYSGASQASLLNLTTEEIAHIERDEFNIKTIILDTNFIMRLLDIQTATECTMAHETFDVLKEMKVKFIVLPCSISEIQASIKYFLTMISPYTARTAPFLKNTTIKMSGLLAAYQRGTSRSAFLELSGNLEKRLRNLGIDVDSDDSFDDGFDDDDIASLISAKDKYNYGKTQAQHDVHLIEYCRKLRPAGCVFFSQAECWVLTNDLKLASWNQHKDSGDLHECISEAQLTNLLWLKRKKTTNTGIINIVVALANQHYIDAEELLRFVNKVETFKETGKSEGNDEQKISTISFVHASNLISANDIQRVNDEELAVDQLYKEKYKEAENQHHNLNEKLEKELAEKIELEERTKNQAVQNSKLSTIIIEKSNLLEVAKEEFALKENNYQQSLQARDDKMRGLQQKLKDLRYQEEMIHVMQKINISTARKIMFILILCFLIILGGSIGGITIINSKFPNWLNWLGSYEDYKIFIVPVITTIPSLIAATIIYIISISLYGCLMSPKDLFNRFKQNKVRKIMTDKYNFITSLPVDSLEGELIKIKQEIDSLSKE